MFEGEEARDDEDQKNESQQQLFARMFQSAQYNRASRPEQTLCNFQFPNS